MHRVLVLITLLILASDLQAAQITIPAIRNQIVRTGAQKTVIMLYESRQWDAVIAQISAGKTAWITLAPKLAPGSDAATAEDLGIALAAALPKNPDVVLSAIDPGNGPVLGWKRVCGAPFIEISDANLRRYFKRANTALSRVINPVLAPIKMSCLDELKTAATAARLPRP